MDNEKYENLMLPRILPDGGKTIEDIYLKRFCHILVTKRKVRLKGSIENELHSTVQNLTETLVKEVNIACKESVVDQISDKFSF